MKFEKSDFQPCKEWIAQKRNEGHEWDAIANLCTSPEFIESTLEEYIDGPEAWPEDLTISLWHEFVEYYKAEYLPVKIQASAGQIIGIDTGLKNDYSEFQPYASAWLNYKNKLSSKVTPDSVAKIERSCKWILNHLSKNTVDSGPIKGLVTGSVQSGKTANMAGLISMAADYDWNFFIILSGTIDNLRIQTRDRFKADLQNCEGVLWRVIDFSGDDKKYSQEELKLNTLNGSKTFSNRYVTVCLKNAKRLESLITWLYSVPARTGKLRVIIIDDEADQASINTADVTQEEVIDRNAINQLIINLVNGKKADGSKPDLPLQAINYISYTATPYANVLNERPGVSLYPTDFICTLPEAHEYFGAKVIFGNGEEDYPGLGIIRDIPTADTTLLKSGKKLPESLKRAIAWFLSASAAVRYNGIKDNFSMLVHTSARQPDHKRIYLAIRDWLTNSSKSDIISLCKTVYDEEREKITAESIKLANPKYDISKISADQLPPFDKLQKELLLIISDITNIQLDTDRKPTFTTGLHICVDNCSANKWADPDTRLRIIYPDNPKSLEKAPLFLVIGGNTLSRGLTIEGLICTYFSRDVNQADTLMQMARWFGYRVKFELLPRIWLTKNVWDKYKALARIDTALKSEVERFMEMGLSPKEFGPRVNTIPDIAKFRLTAANRMQNAEPCDFNFSGYGYETTEFDWEEQHFQDNYNLTLRFINTLRQSHAGHRSTVTNSYVWNNVPSSSLKNEFFDEFYISPHSHLNKDINYFLTWLDAQNELGKYCMWNIVLVDGDYKDGQIIFDGQECGAVERTRKTSVTTHIDIGSLRSGLDALSDVDTTNLTEGQNQILAQAKKHKKDLISIRGKLNLEDHPLLLIYRIKKDGGVAKDGRAPLQLNVDPVGISFIISGQERKSYIQAVHIAMKRKEE